MMQVDYSAAAEQTNQLAPTDQPQATVSISETLRDLYVRLTDAAEEACAGGGSFREVEGIISKIRSFR